MNGRSVVGIVGYKNLSVAGISANQTFALVSFPTYEGDNTISELFGFAYPAL